MIIIVAMAAVFGLAYAFTHRGGNRTKTPDRWQPNTSANVAAHAGAVPTGTQGGAAVQLARIEGRQLLRNETFIVGVFLSIAIVVLFGIIWASDNAGSTDSWRFGLALIPVFTLPFAGLTLAAVNGAVLRSRRDGAEELFESLPANPTTRVAGHVGSVWAAFAIQVLFVCALAAAGRYRSHAFGAIDASSIGDVVVSFVLVGCAVALGVALARWLPYPLVALASLVALGVIATIIGGIGGAHWSLTRQLSIWPRYPVHDPLFAVRPTWWHAAYLGALGVLMVIAAVARSRRDRSVAILAVAAATIAVVAGVIQTRPMSPSDAARIAALVSDPVAHSTCRTEDGLTLCAYHDYADILDNWERDLTASFAAVAPGKRATGFTVLWREPRPDRLDPAVLKRLDVDTFTAPATSDRGVWNGVALEVSESVAVNRIALGLWSADLPLAPDANDVPCSVGGQARGVVALWVAAQGITEVDASVFVSGTWTHTRDEGSEVPPSWVDGHIWWVDSTPPVLWSAPDVAAAQAVVNLDPRQVRDVLWSDWSQWINPTTTTGDLLAALGLPTVGPPGSLPVGTSTCR